jgi:hypothetical protein
MFQNSSFGPYLYLILQKFNFDQFNVDVASASHLSDSTATSIFFFCLLKIKKGEDCL